MASSSPPRRGAMATPTRRRAAAGGRSARCEAPSSCAGGRATAAAEAALLGACARVASAEAESPDLAAIAAALACVPCLARASGRTSQDPRRTRSASRCLPTSEVGLAGRRRDAESHEAVAGAAERAVSATIVCGHVMPSAWTRLRSRSRAAGLTTFVGFAAAAVVVADCRRPCRARARRRAAHDRFSLASARTYVSDAAAGLGGAVRARGRAVRGRRGAARRRIRRAAAPADADGQRGVGRRALPADAGRGRGASGSTRAAERWRESYADAPPGSWGRPIGAIKALILAGDWAGAEEAARWALAEGAARGGVADRPLRRCARLLVLGDWDARAVHADAIRIRDDFPRDVGDALAMIAAEDVVGYVEAVESVLESFETRDDVPRGRPGRRHGARAPGARAAPRDLAAELRRRRCCRLDAAAAAAARSSSAIVPLPADEARRRRPATARRRTRASTASAFASPVTR